MLDRFCAEAGAGHTLLYVWLRASQAVRNQRRIQRARDDADQPEHFDFLDALIPDLTDTAASTRTAAFVEIDTATLTPSEVAQHVRTSIRM